MTFSNVLIRCSSLGCLFTEPQSKADRERGELSKTAKTHLVDVYVRELWGIEKQLDNKFVNKGIECEDDAILLLSRVDGQLYEKNDERKSNEWITGHADIVTPDVITDIKTSWNANTFMAKMVENVDGLYFYQLQGYLALWGLKQARISYCLVNTPEGIINGEKYKLSKQMDVISDESPAFKREWAKLEPNFLFDHIDPKLRVINHLVERNDEIIEQIPQKVQKAREFLAQLHEKHINHNKLVLA